MGSMSLIHWIIVGAVLLLLFGGKNKISDVMGDVAKGIKSFKKGLTEDEEAAKHPSPMRPAEPVRTIDHYAPNQPQPYAAQPQPVAHAETEPGKVG